MKALTGAIGLLLVVGVLWNAGEKHVENCQSGRKVACTVLPWSGHYPEPVALPETTQSRTDAAVERVAEERRKLLREACLNAGTC